MNIINADILSPQIMERADAICFTSNGVVTAKNELVMGAGNALQFKERWPVLPRKAGYLIKQSGNHCYLLHLCPITEVSICNFPTKNNWRDNSDINLIRQSSIELMRLINKWNWNMVFLCAPGIGHGGLQWSVVKDTIEPIFDERVTICFRNK